MKIDITPEERKRLTSYDVMTDVTFIGCRITRLDRVDNPYSLAAIDEALDAVEKLRPNLTMNISSAEMDRYNVYTKLVNMLHVMRHHTPTES